MQYITLSLKICEFCGVNFARLVGSDAKLCIGCERNIARIQAVAEPDSPRTVSVMPGVAYSKQPCIELGCCEIGRIGGRCQRHYTAFRRHEARKDGICVACYTKPIAKTSKSRCKSCLLVAVAQARRYKAVSC